jgi:hypothetical protein
MNVLATAFGTASSVATLPFAIKALGEIKFETFYTKMKK